MVLICCFAFVTSVRSTTITEGPSASRKALETLYGKAIRQPENRGAVIREIFTYIVGRRVRQEDRIFALSLLRDLADPRAQPFLSRLASGETTFYKSDELAVHVATALLAIYYEQMTDREEAALFLLEALDAALGDPPPRHRARWIIGALCDLGDRRHARQISQAIWRTYYGPNRNRVSNKCAWQAYIVEASDDPVMVGLDVLSSLIREIQALALERKSALLADQILNLQQMRQQGFIGGTDRRYYQRPFRRLREMGFTDTWFKVVGIEPTW